MVYRCRRLRYDILILMQLGELCFNQIGWMGVDPKAFNSGNVSCTIGIMRHFVYP